MSSDHNQYQKNDFNPDYDAMAVLVEENQRLAKQLSELKDWEAIAAERAITIAMMKSEQAEFQELVAKVHDLEKQACEIIRREWIGLTDEEILVDAGSVVCSYSGLLKFARDIEANLKEKNHHAPRQYTDLCGND